MQTTDTKYGTLLIPDRREELDSWDLDTALAWLVLNDPNGEWLSYLNDREWAIEELGELTVEDARDVVWEQSRDA